MALTQAIENGKVVDTKTDSSKSNTTNTYDKELFLNLLVAEMKYQDPLEPTSNTEWVSQYATFSQVEQMEDMAKSLNSMQSENLVGKTVIMKSTEKSGDTSYYTGQVSYVERQSDGSYRLCVLGSKGEKMFNYDEIDTICDPDYLNAVTLADAFGAIMEQLPEAEYLTADKVSAVKAARTAYDSMTTYQKQFVSEDTLNKLLALEKMAENYAQSE